MDQRQWIKFPKLPDQFPLSTDSVLLANFAAPANACRIMDLGAGCGTLGLLLAASNSHCSVEGLELQLHSVQQAEEVIGLNALEDRVHVTQGDIRNITALYPANSFDAVLSNPPYFPVGHGAAAASEALAIARTELCCTLQDLCRAASYLLRWGAPFYLIHKPERLCDIFSALRQNRLEPKRLRLVRHKASAAPALVLMESRLGGNPNLNILPDLILRNEDGSETQEYRSIYGLEE